MPIYDIPNTHDLSNAQYKQRLEDGILEQISATWPDPRLKGAASIPELKGTIIKLKSASSIKEAPTEVEVSGIMYFFTQVVLNRFISVYTSFQIGDIPLGRMVEVCKYICEFAMQCLEMNAEDLKKGREYLLRFIDKPIFQEIILSEIPEE